MLILSINWSLILYAAFLGSILLIVLFIVIGKRLGNKNNTENESAIDKIEKKSPEGISGAESAAIAMALHLFYAVQDEESNIITIKNIHNSPWNLKIYGIQ
jgi:Na+/proline symporter